MQPDSQIDKKTPQTADEYISVVRILSSMINSSLDSMIIKVFTSEDEKLKELTRAAEVVETIASLRGDSGLFRDMRPKGLIEYQKEMYAIEDALREKLVGLGYKYPQRGI